MILVLYVESGTGSLTLAKNVCRELNYQNVDCQLVSLHDLLPLWLNKLIFGSYENWCIKERNYFRVLFKSKWFYPSLYKLLPLIMYCKEGGKKNTIPPLLQKAEAVVCCSFFCGWFSRYWMENKIPVYGVLGDYTVSPGWRLAVNRLFIPFDFQSDVFTYIRRNGGKITVSGIPASYHKTVNEPEIGCVMIGGGGWGLQISFDTIENLINQPFIKKLIVLCGTNKKLFDEIHTRFSTQIVRERLEIYSYTHEMAELYARTNIVVTKAGGLTLTEAALSGKPIIITGYLPGHEEDNMKVFLDHNAAIYAGDETTLINAIHTLLTEKSLANSIKNNAASLVNTQAGYLIGRKLKKELNYVDA